MSAPCFALFATALGHCAVIWSEQGIVRLLLPHASEAALRDDVFAAHPNAIEKPPDANASTAILGIQRLLEGGTPDFSAVILDMENVPAFHRDVYAHTRRIPPGKTLSYGDIAARVGKPSAARAVGQALGRNPWALIVPCHRVLAANGRLTGFSAPGGIATKRRLLEIEGALGHR
ncbi:MAG TPA: methylated-DNA--[protein]-cysteine S-methyltransferase [Polyangiaceae bacterium]